MQIFLKKTILSFTLIGIVFLAGGVGVVWANNHTTDQQTKPDARAEARSEVLSGVDQSTVDAQKVLGAVKCGKWYSMIDPNCWMPILTYRFYQAISLILLLSGSIFDFMLALSIDKKFIDRDFVHEIWKVMRDVANMMFIFILIYAGIRTMLLGDDWKKPVMNVVIIALLINFSLFFTNIVIDAGNTLALGVYSRMGVVKTSGSHKNKTSGDVEERNLSETLVGAFAPEKFLKLSGEMQDLAPTVFIIAGAISGVAAWIFFKAAFLFMGRLLAFWFLMMWSPIAFIMFASPQLAKQAKFSFDDWLQMLINQAFVAPVFLFMIYIIMTFIQKGKLLESLTNPTGAGFFFDNIFAPIVTAAMIIYALKKSLSIAESMAGYFGKIGADIGNKVFGLAAAGTGVGLTAGVGAVAGAALRSDTLKGMVDSKNWAMSRIGAIAETGLKGAHEKPMDFRNISIGGKKLGEHLGIESFGLKKGYKQLKEEKTEEIKGRGQTANEARIAAQTTRDDAAKAAKDARIDAETKAKVTKEAKQTTVGKQAETRKDTKRAYDSTPAGVTAGATKANEQEIRRQIKKESVDNPFQTTPTSPVQKSLRDQLSDKKTRHDVLQLEDTGGVVGGHGGTLSSLAEQADTRFEIAKSALDITPISIPNPALAGVPATIANPTQGATPAYIPNPALAGVPTTITNPDRMVVEAEFTSTKTAKNTAEKKLKEFKEGADSIEKLEKKIEEYSAL